MEPVRMGLLGAARIAPRALIQPARAMDEVVVAAVAARDRRRAERLARRAGIPRVHGDYAALVDDPEIDAVYIPLPNGLHCAWTVRALAAGKHVLCEKPLAANADEARRMAAAAAASGRVLMEALHYHYHPLAARMREIVASGLLGGIRHIEATFAVPMLRRGDIRFRYDLAGGATMDLGAYTVHLLRSLGGGEPVVTHARAALADIQVDRWMTAFLRFPDGATGQMTVALRSATLKVEVRVLGERGEMRVVNPILPHLFHRLTLRTAERTSVERFAKTPTYRYQLRAFVDAVRRGVPAPTGPADSVANMEVIDAIYAAAGLHRRGDGPAAWSIS